MPFTSKWSSMCRGYIYRYSEILSTHCTHSIPRAHTFIPFFLLLHRFVTEKQKESIAHMHGVSLGVCMRYKLYASYWTKWIHVQGVCVRVRTISRGYIDDHILLQFIDQLREKSNRFWSASHANQYENSYVTSFAITVSLPSLLQRRCCECTILIHKIP